jgi:hypothetical protein
LAPVRLNLRPFFTMKNRFLPFAIALLLSLPSAALVRAADAPKPDAKPEHKEPETELGKTMEKLNGSWRKLKKQAADPASNAASLELVAAISAGMEKALTFKPAKTDDLPAAEREKFVQEYQKDMKEVMALLPKLEAAFKANDNTAAQALIQKIGAMQKEAHKEFKRPDM